LTDFRKFLENHAVTASAPCRVDMGGTLDIATFCYPLCRYSPATVNIALDLRTSVRLLACRRRVVRVSSTGFAPAEFPPEQAPLDHPLGLIFAVALYFGLEGVEIQIDSHSPVRSALGGSSVAMVALIGALAKIAEAGGERRMSRKEVALLAHGLESAVARVPCGIQDQLAAAFGGVNLWHWRQRIQSVDYRREVLVKSGNYGHLEKRLLVAYAGEPHESKDINGQWVDRFLAGRDRNRWIRVVDLVHRFSESLRRMDIRTAGRLMNQETAIRLEMTPDVLDDIGRRLYSAAAELGCGARFSGAGGGGCLWALGGRNDMEELHRVWREILSTRRTARLLEVRVDSRGLLCQLDPDVKSLPRTVSTPNGQRTEK
jgi:D-glycero-alpha-D-manno-heptose-7-phosphate kinase